MSNILALLVILGVANPSGSWSFNKVLAPPIQSSSDWWNQLVVGINLSDVQRRHLKGIDSAFYMRLKSVQNEIVGTSEQRVESMLRGIMLRRISDTRGILVPQQRKVFDRNAAFIKKSIEGMKLRIRADSSIRKVN